MNKKNITILAFITIFGVGVFVTVFSVLSNQTKNTSASKPQESLKDPVSSTIIMEPMKPVRQISPPDAKISEVQPINTYKDGNYNATASYKVPSGDTEKINTVISIQNDTITAIKNTNEANNRISREYQSSFESKIQSAAVGKKIDSLSLNSVGGASLTTNAFTKAVSEVKSKAKT